MSIVIRPEQPSDHQDIKRIHNQAFGQPDEALIVDRLRDSTFFIPQLSLLAICNHALVGHVLFSVETIVDGSVRHPSLALGPMAVMPGYQNRGIGSLLVQEGLHQARLLGYSSVIVLGHAGYYPRFGFQKAAFFNIHAPFKVPDEAFMVLELKENGLQKVQGVVEYPGPWSI